MSRVSSITSNAQGPIHAPELLKNSKKMRSKTSKQDSALQAIREVRLSAEDHLRMEKLRSSAKDWTDDTQFDRVYKKFSHKRMEKVLEACNSIWHVAHDLALSKPELFNICLFIQTELQKKVQQGMIYLKKEEIGTARTIEYDPKTKRTFIHLKAHNIPRVGRGKHKEVTKSILYHAIRPKIVANCVGYDRTIKQEAKVLKKLGNKQGLPKTYAVTSHRKEGTGKKATSIILKFFNGKTLGKYMRKVLPITQRERMLAARDIMYGIEHLHRLGLVHRDMHPGNCLCERNRDAKTPSNGFSAAIVDFGQVRSFKQARKLAPRVEVPRRLVPPEVLQKRWRRIDPGKVEVYAVGLNFYHLFFGDMPEWTARETFYKLRKISYKERKHFKKDLEHDIKKWTRARRDQLKSNPDVWGDFGHLILQMCHQRPEKRETAHKVRKKIDGMLKRLIADGIP